MSDPKSKLIREAIKTQVEAHADFTGETVWTFAGLPRWEASDFENLTNKRAIVCRAISRDLQLMQGVSKRQPIINIGVAGVLGVRTDSKKTITEQDRDLIDSYELILEKLVDAFMDKSRLSLNNFADHRLIDIDQTLPYDASLAHENNVYLALLSLTFEDSDDEFEDPDE